MRVPLWPGWLAYSVVTYTFLNLAILVPPVVDDFGVSVGRAGLIGTVLNVALSASATWLTFKHLKAKPALLAGFGLQALGNLATATAGSHPVYLAWAIPTGLGMGMALAGGYRVVVAGDDVGRRTSIITSAVPVTALTTLLGGAIVSWGGWPLSHLVMGGYAAVAFLAVAANRIPEPGHDPAAPTGDVLRRLSRDYLASAVWAIGMSGVLVFLGAQLEGVFGVGPVGLGGVVAMTGVVGFATTLVVARLDDELRGRVLAPVLALSGILAYAYVASPTVWWAIAAVGVWAVTYWAGFTIIQAVIGTDAGDDQAAALTFFQAPWSLGLAAGPALVGVLVDRYGFTMIGWAGFAAAGLAAYLFRVGR